MSEQYGGPWNDPVGGAPIADPARRGDPSQAFSGQGHPAQPGYPAPPGYASAPPYPSAQAYPGSPGQQNAPGYPPQAYGYPGAGGYPGVPPLRNDYAPWGKRVGAYLIDFLPALLGVAVFYVGYGIAIFGSLQSASASLDLEAGAGWMIVGGVLTLLGQAWTVYNRWITGGRTGQSMGKRVTRISLIGEETGAPVGALNAFLRDLVHILDGFAYVGYLWPLWDDRKQTFSDKIMKTVVVTVRSTPS